MRVGAVRLAPHEWKRQPLWLRLRIWLAYGITRSLISFFGFERYH